LIALFAIAAGVIAERVVAVLFSKRKQRLIEAVSHTLWGDLKIIYARLAFDIVGILTFAAVGYFVLANYYPAGTLPFLFIYTFVAACTAGGMAFFWRAFISRPVVLIYAFA
jgi:hypothetical protein